MEINPNRALNRIHQAKPKGKPDKSSSSKAASPVESDISGALSLGSLEDELNALPEVHENKLEEGAVLARDPAYPDRDELNKLGSLVVRDELRGELSNQ